MMLHRLLPACATAVFVVPLICAGGAAAAGPRPAALPGPPAAAAAVDLAVLVYDPRDVLALPGDTHALTVSSFGEYTRQEIPGQDLRATLRSYRCGPHEPAVPPGELSCGPAGDDLDGVAVAGSRLDVTAAGVLRVRGLLAGRPLDLTVTGSGGSPAFVHTWQHAEGTRRTAGRTTATGYATASTAGTFGAVPVAQNASTPSWLRTYRTTVRTGSGPALPLPALPPVGTEQGGWSTTAVASAGWQRSLPPAGPAGTRDLETGTLTARAGAGDQAGIAVHITHRRCPVADGGCQLLATESGGEPGSVRFDPVAGTAQVRQRVSMAAQPGQEAPRNPELLLDFRWQGERPAGFHEVDTVTGPDQPDWRQERSGIRWSEPAVAGTVNGSPVRQVAAAALSAYRERTTQTG